MRESVALLKALVSGEGVGVVGDETPTMPQARARKISREGEISHNQPSTPLTPLTTHSRLTLRIHFTASHRCPDGGTTE